MDLMIKRNAIAERFNTNEEMKKEIRLFHFVVGLEAK